MTCTLKRLQPNLWSFLYSLEKIYWILSLVFFSSMSSILPVSALLLCTTLYLVHISIITLIILPIMHLFDYIFCHREFFGQTHIPILNVTKAWYKVDIFFKFVKYEHNPSMSMALSTSYIIIILNMYIHSWPLSKPQIHYFWLPITYLHRDVPHASTI